MSVFVVVVVLAMIIVVGLVIDGGQRARAISRAESVAAGAARAAGNASAADEVSGRAEVAPVPAAEAFLAAAPDVEGTVTLVDGRVRVTTRSTRPTIFLSLVGIGSVSGTGSADADVVAVGGG